MKKYLLSVIVLFIYSLSKAQSLVIDSFLHGGIYRTYQVYIPAAVDGSKPVPLLFNLHGLGSNGDEQMHYGDFRPIADTAHFIVVQPTGDNVILAYRGWNCFITKGTGTDDISFIDRLIDTLSHKYNINLNQVYATGMSNGGFMSYELACFLSHRIAAIASVTGSMTLERVLLCDTKHPTPVMEIHGTADNTVGYDGTNYISGSPAFSHIDSLMRYWVQKNKCNPLATKTLIPNTVLTDASTVEHYVWKDGLNHSRVELMKVINGGHTWPGSSYITGTTNQDINASLEIWKFFRQFSLNTLSHVQNNFAHNNIQILPNPSYNYVDILLDQFTNTPTSITLYNLLGQNLYQQSLNSNTTRIDLSTLNSGIYYIVLQQKDQYSTHKIVKL